MGSIRNGVCISMEVCRNCLFISVVPKKSTLITALSTGDKAAIQRTVFQMEKSAGGGECNFDFPYTKRIKLSKEDKSVSLSRRVSINQCLDERCNGNQNIMHVAASNILKTESKGIVWILFHGEVMNCIFTSHDTPARQKLVLFCFMYKTFSRNKNLTCIVYL